MCSIRASLKPLPPPNGLHRPGVIRPDIWEQLHPDDVKFAAKMALRDWKDEWRGKCRCSPAVNLAIASHMWSSDRLEPALDSTQTMNLTFAHCVFFAVAFGMKPLYPDENEPEAETTEPAKAPSEQGIGSQLATASAAPEGQQKQQVAVKPPPLLTAEEIRDIMIKFGEQSSHGKHITVGFGNTGTRAIIP